MFESWLILMTIVLPLLIKIPLPYCLANLAFVMLVGIKLKRKWIIFAPAAFFYTIIIFFIFFPRPSLLSAGYHELNLKTDGFSQMTPQGNINTRAGIFTLKDSRTNAVTLPAGTSVKIRCDALPPFHGKQNLKILELKILKPATPPSILLSKIRKGFHTKIQNQIIHPEIAALLEGLILGNRSYLEYGVLQSFRITGIAHLLALSGLHVGIISILLITLITPLFGKKTALITASLAVIFYMLLSGMSASILRAGLMFLLANILDLFHRPARWEETIGTVGIFLIIINPFILLSAGYWLSFGAVLGIVIGIRFFDGGLKILPQPLREWTAISFSAQWGTIGPQLLWFGSFSPLSLIANPIIVPLFSILSYALFFYFFLILTPLPLPVRNIIEMPIFGLWKIIQTLSENIALFGFINTDLNQMPVLSKSIIIVSVLVWPFIWLRLRLSKPVGYRHTTITPKSSR